MLDIVLYEPQIAPNTGNIIRLVANNGFRLHLIQPLGFEMDEKKLRRAGLDYRELAHVSVHENYKSFISGVAERRVIACTTKGVQSYTSIDFRSDDILLFGAETHGLSDYVMTTIPPSLRVRIPMKENNRSLNLANSVAIVSYEAWRQLGFIGGG